MPGLTYRSGPAVIELSGDGVVTDVRHTAHPRWNYLTSAGEVLAWVRGAAVTWSAPVVEADADELEVSRTSADLRLVVRHSFSVGWGLRVALSSTAADELVLDDVVVSWRAAPDRVSWALGAGAAASTAVFAPDGTGPLLGAVLRSGSVPQVSPEGLHLGRLVLAPRSRYVAQWHAGFHASPQAFGRGLHPDVPTRLDLELGESAVVATTEDEALVLSPGLAADPVRGGQELLAATAGSHDVEVRSARGATIYQLRVAERWDELLEAAARAALDAPPSGAGVLQLAGLDSALVVQAALARGVLADPYPAEDALDLFGVRMSEDEQVSARLIGFLCGEHERTGDPEPLRRAGEAVLATRRPEPGLGLVSTQLCLALVLAGQPVSPVVGHLQDLAAGSGLAPDAAPLAEQTALLELEVVTMPRAARTPRASGPSGGAEPTGPTWQPGAVVARTAALGTWLGGGLRGHAVPPLPLERLAHLAAVLALLPDPVSAQLRDRWGCTAHELARRARTEVLTRLEGPTPGPAHAWLVLGSRPG